MESLSFERIADRYDATRGGDGRGRDFAEVVRPHLAAGTVLEVGVGTGVVAAALADLGLTVGGIDVSESMARRAHGRIGPRVGLGDSRALPLRDASVENVLFVMVLHVVGDVDATLREAVRVLRPGGRVVAIHGLPVPVSADDDVAGALAPLSGVRGARPDEPAALAEAAARAGLHPVHNGMTTPIELSHSPAGTADEIESRTWSYLWAVNDADWDRVVVPTLTALRALPEPDRQRPYSQQHRLSVFGR